MRVRVRNHLLTGVVAVAACLFFPIASNERPTRVRIVTSVGGITVELDDGAHATSCNFLRYVQSGYYDGGSFVRTVRADIHHSEPHTVDLIQAAARNPNNRYQFDAFGPIELESTDQTGLSHVAGALSMVRESATNSATSGFFIVIEDSQALDYGGSGGKRDKKGFAVFGRVVEGMEVARSIQLSPTEPANDRHDTFSGNQWLDPPVRILSARVAAGHMTCEYRT